MSAAKHIAVIGAGWAGCAAAVALVEAGHKVSLYEAGRTLGGRARAVEVEGKTLDNGQHILLGAYRDSLKMMKKVGIDLNASLLRLPLQMNYPVGSDGMRFQAGGLPTPFHLALALFKASGLSRDDKMALARFSTTARWMDWRLDTDCSVLELLERFDQTPRLTRLMWAPLCIAALNTPPERASAQVFLAVLRDSLGANRAASDMLLPRVDLSSLFPNAASAWLQKNGASVNVGVHIKAIMQSGEQWQLQSDHAGTIHDGVVVATGVSQAAKLLAAHTKIDQLEHFQHEPITTCYLGYASDVKLDKPLYALLDDPAQGQWGQFVFDRGQLDANQAGILSVVVSVSELAVERDRSVLASEIAQQLALHLQRPDLATPLWSQVISEKRATFACAPGLVRPDNRTDLPNVVLAGDYTVSEYPATIEAAVRSGIAAARVFSKV